MMLVSDWIGTNKMSKYEIILYWSEDDQSFIAEVPELSDV